MLENTGEEEDCMHEGCRWRQEGWRWREEGGGDGGKRGGDGGKRGVVYIEHRT